MQHDLRHGGESRIGRGRCGVKACHGTENVADVALGAVFHMGMITPPMKGHPAYPLRAASIAIDGFVAGPVCGSSEQGGQHFLQTRDQVVGLSCALGEVFDLLVLDGDLLPQKIVLTFEARNEFEVTSGDSSAVQLALNGQNVPLAGKPGKRGSARLSRKDLKPAAAPPR